LALYLVFRQSGLFAPSISLVVAFLTAAIVLGIWTRFWRRPI